MSTYLVIHTIPYEGGSSEMFDTLEKAKEHIKSYRNYLDEFEVYEVTKTIDVYELIEETNDG